MLARFVFALLLSLPGIGLAVSAKPFLLGDQMILLGVVSAVSLPVAFLLFAPQLAQPNAPIERQDSGSCGGGVMPSLDAVRFDTAGYDYQGETEPGIVRVWHTPEGDGLGVYFFAVPPDLPQLAASIEDLASFYRRLLGDSGSILVEANVVVAGGCPAVRAILSVRQQASGRTYIGSLTVPFRDFSFVVKCQCSENEPTGLKESILFDRSIAANELMQIEEGRFHIPGWNPDDPKFDAEFPNHPVARVRRVLKHVTGSLIVASEIRKLPSFALPK